MKYQQVINHLLFSNHDNTPLNVKSKYLKHGKGSPTLQVIFHEITDDSIELTDGTKKLKLIQKKLPHTHRIGKEISTYRIFHSIGGKRNITEAFVRHPEIYSIDEYDNEINVFMEYAEGKKLSVTNDNAYNLGLMLGKMSLEYGEIFPDDYPFHKGRTSGKWFTKDDDIIFAIMKNTKKTENALKTIKKLYELEPIITKWKNEAKRVLCHNDFKNANAVVADSKGINGQILYILDWASTGYDTIGSDIGGVFFNNHFDKLEMNQESHSVEIKLYSGYLSSLGLQHSKANLEEIQVVANLHFAVRFGSWAIRSKNKKLLERSILRAEQVVKSFE